MNSEAKIESLVSLMENPAEIWKKAPLEVRRILQEIIFPFDIKANPGTEEFEKVGTHNLSPLYSVIPQKMTQMSHLTPLWCPRLDLNQHAVRHMLLRHTCIPISPLGHADII